jgi:hypothetical protein
LHLTLAKTLPTVQSCTHLLIDPTPVLLGEDANLSECHEIVRKLPTSSGIIGVQSNDSENDYIKVQSYKYLASNHVQDFDSLFAECLQKW